MARMKIDMPDLWQFSMNVKVRVSDLNYGNHLANQVILVYAQEARMAYFKKFGYSELDFGGVSLIQADAGVIYKCEGHLDDEIEIKLTAVQAGNSSFNVFYKMINLTKQKDLAHVRTAIACYDYASKRPVSLPQSVLNSELFLTSS